MNPAEALQEAAMAGRLGRFDVSRHGLQRMRERNVTRRDIALALQSATEATLQENGRWRLRGGQDDEGEPLGLVVVFHGGCLVVTVF